MSWTLNATVAGTDDVLVGDAIDKAVAALEVQYAESDYTLTDESKAQIAAGKEAAIAIVKSGAVGQGVPLSISLSGHSNPNHAPVAGYANDSIQVAIWQTEPAS
jgi:hypothetical protein